MIKGSIWHAFLFLKITVSMLHAIFILLFKINKSAAYFLGIFVCLALWREEDTAQGLLLQPSWPQTLDCPLALVS